MTLTEAIATQGPVLRAWVAWMGVAMVATPLILLAFRDSRRDGIVAAGALVANLMFMQWLYAQVGYVRLLGLPHVLIWTPLALYLWLRLRQGGLPRIPQIAAAVFLVTMLISLAFDYVDVARWLLGERGSMLPA